MGEQDIIRVFPRLGLDKKFVATSKPDINYNCIAWAGLKDDEYWWPELKPYPLDGVKYKWPFNLTNSVKLRYFIDLFTKLGYTSVSNNINNEHPNFRKIALFIIEDKTIPDILDCVCTHAARQKASGLWASKLGSYHDIEHSDPYDLEGQNPCYGKLAIILQKSL